MIRPLSDDHTGYVSPAGSNVKRVSVCRPGFATQMSCSSSATNTAIRLPSGETRG